MRHVIDYCSECDPDEQNAKRHCVRFDAPGHDVNGYTLTVTLCQDCLAEAEGVAKIGRVRASLDALAAKESEHDNLPF